MATLQVREIPDQIYYKLKKEAAKKHRSLTQQAIITLAKGLDTQYDPKEKRADLLDKLKDRGKTKTLQDSVKLVREDRER